MEPRRPRQPLRRTRPVRRQATPSQDAKAVVTSFLEAIRKGDNDAATKLLTKVARQKAEETGRCVAPAGE